MIFQTHTQSCYIYRRKAQLFIVLSPYLTYVGKWKTKICDTTNPSCFELHMPEQLLNLSCLTPLMMNMQIFLCFVFSIQNLSMWQGQEWQILLIIGTGFAMRALARFPHHAALRRWHRLGAQCAHTPKWLQLWGSSWGAARYPTPPQGTWNKGISQR